MSYNSLAESIKGICTNVLVNEPMNKHTSFKTGGPCDIMVLPENETQIAQVLKLCKENEVPCFIMGNGSNLLVSDKGIEGVVIKLGKVLCGYRVDGTSIAAQSGLLLSKLAVVALKNSLTGLEFASGIPGTVGGAVVMNAGAYGGEMKDVVIKTTYIDENGDIQTVTGEEHQFSYRYSIFANNPYCVLSSTFGLNKGKPEEIEKKMNELNARRREKQPLECPSAGSAFKRPVGCFAAQLIEDAGLKGYTAGGAQVSTKHSGFIINAGNATSEDVLQVMEHVKKEVLRQFNIELCSEIKFIGKR